MLVTKDVSSVEGTTTKWYYIEVARFKLLNLPWFDANVNLYCYFILFQKSVVDIFLQCEQLSYSYSWNKEKYISFGNNLAFKYQNNLAFYICTGKLLYLPFSNFYGDHIKKYML